LAQWQPDWKVFQSPPLHIAKPLGTIAHFEKAKKMNVIEKIETQLNGNAIYKFMPFNIYSLETIINKKLYFGDPNFQNDPVENSY